MKKILLILALLGIVSGMCINLQAAALDDDDEYAQNYDDDDDEQAKSWDDGEND